VIGERVGVRLAEKFSPYGGVEGRPLEKTFRGPEATARNELAGELSRVETTEEGAV
jgi:hypothetical protein